MGNCNCGLVHSTEEYMKKVDEILMNIAISREETQEDSDER